MPIFVNIGYSKLNRKVLYHFRIFAIIIKIFNIKVANKSALRYNEAGAEAV